MTVVREREVTRPVVGELLDVGDVVADAVAVLDAHQRDELAGLHDAANVGGCARDLDLVRRHLLGQLVHRFELGDVGVVGALEPFRREVVVLADVDAEKDAVVAGLHLRNIHLPAQARDVVGRRVTHVAGVEIDMRVELDHAVVDRLGLRDERGVGLLRSEGRGNQEEGECRAADRRARCHGTITV